MKNSKEPLSFVTSSEYEKSNEHQKAKSFLDVSHTFDMTKVELVRL